MDIAPSPVPSLPLTAPAVPAARSAFLAAVLGWLIPGGGQLYMGRWFKALVMLVAIGGLFLAGLVLTGFTCVNPETYSLEFAAHAFLGGPTAAAYYLTQGLSLSEAMPWFEVGRLYAAVAGLLNVVAVCDALGDVIEHNRQARLQADLRRRFLEDRAAEHERALAAARRFVDEEEAPDAPAEDAGDDAPDAPLLPFASADPTLEARPHAPGADEPPPAGPRAGEPRP